MFRIIPLPLHRRLSYERKDIGGKVKARENREKSARKWFKV